MSTSGRDEDLTEALGSSQRLGLLGARPMDEVIAHARMYVRALTDLPSGAVVVDLGSGGGVPGVVIAHDRPDLRLWLVDRRRKRTDVLERMVHRYAWLAGAVVIPADVSDVIDRRTRSGLTDDVDAIDAVVARGFGPPDETLMFASSLVRPGGLIVISEPPEGDRWSAEMLEASGTVRHKPPAQRPTDRIAAFLRTS